MGGGGVIWPSTFRGFLSSFFWSCFFLSHPQFGLSLPCFDELFLPFSLLFFSFSSLLLFGLSLHPLFSCPSLSVVLPLLWLDEARPGPAAGLGHNITSLSTPVVFDCTHPPSYSTPRRLLVHVLSYTLPIASFSCRWERRNTGGALGSRVR